MAQAIADGVFRPMNEKKLPELLLPSEQLRPTSPAPSTSPSSAAEKKEDAGPTNNWMSPAEDGRAKVRPLYDGCMKGRTMYVMPYVHGPARLPDQQGRRRDHRQRSTSSRACGS